MLEGNKGNGKEKKTYEDGGRSQPLRLGVELQFSNRVAWEGLVGKVALTKELKEAQKQAMQMRGGAFQAEGTEETLTFNFLNFLTLSLRRPDKGRMLQCC